jgi:nucleoside-diphosphate-sugar epimerase
MTDAQVLVTGGSEFVGSHCVVALLNAGYRVSTTVRSPERQADVRDMAARAADNAADTLTSPSPTSRPTLGGLRPAMAATSCFMSLRRSHRMSRKTKTR